MWFGEVVLALPDLDGDEGRRLRRRGGRRPGARGAEGDAAARGALRLRPRRARWRGSAAPCASARGAPRSRATGSRSRSRRPTRPSCGPRCASAARSRPAASPGVLLVPRDAVFLRDSGPVVWARRALGWSEVEVKLGRSNRTQVEVARRRRRGRPAEPGRPRAAGGAAGRGERRELAMRRAATARASGPSPAAGRGGARPAGALRSVGFVGLAPAPTAWPPSRCARAASCVRSRRAAR